MVHPPQIRHAFADAAVGMTLCTHVGPALAFTTFRCLLEFGRTT